MVPAWISPYGLSEEPEDDAGDPPQPDSARSAATPAATTAAGRKFNRLLKVLSNLVSGAALAFWSESLAESGLTPYD